MKKNFILPTKPQQPVVARISRHVRPGIYIGVTASGVSHRLESIQNWQVGSVVVAISGQIVGSGSMSGQQSIYEV